MRDLRDRGTFSNDVITGAIAGLTATAPMTMVMDALHRRLPAEQRFELPPREITARIAKKAGVLGALDERTRRNLTLINHFGYGAAMGALYGGTVDKLSLPGAFKGPAFGLAVWAASYMGWLPAVGILPPATRMSRERNALMIAAHLAWGLSTAVVTHQLQRSAANSFSRQHDGVTSRSKAMTRKRDGKATGSIRLSSGAL
jgi:hypothetical protein